MMMHIPTRLLATSILVISTGITRDAATAAAADPSRVEVSFPAKDGLQLEGTLRLPDSGLWPVPGVVLMHGSGETISRDQVANGQNYLSFGFDIPMFQQIGDALQKEGIAILTYDKRTCGRFNGGCSNNYPEPDWDNVRVRTFMEDALAATTYLQGREEIRPDSVVVAGYSQSAQFVHIMFQSNPTIQAGAMLAGAFHPVDTLIEYQLDVRLDILQKMGYNETQALDLTSGLVKIVEELKAIRAGTSDEPVLGGSAAFWRDWFDFHEESLLAAANASQPTLIVNGGMDWNVPVTDADAWGDYLTQVGATFEKKVFPCVTHVLNCVSQPDALKITVADIGTEVDPEVTSALIQFVKDSTGDGESGAPTLETIRAQAAIWKAAGILFWSLF